MEVKFIYVALSFIAVGECKLVALIRLRAKFAFTSKVIIVSDNTHIGIKLKWMLFMYGTASILSTQLLRVSVKGTELTTTVLEN